MIDTIIISGGNIQNGFALDFLKKRIEESRGKKITLVAADKGMEWFMKNREFIPDLAVGDFDSLSEEGKKYMESLKGPEIIRLKPEKDDSDTQSAVNQMIRRGAKDILILGATGTRLDHVLANLGLLSMGKERVSTLRSQISGIILHLQKAEPYCTERSSLENMFHSLLWEVM